MVRLRKPSEGEHHGLGVVLFSPHNLQKISKHFTNRTFAHTLQIQVVDEQNKVGLMNELVSDWVGFQVGGPSVSGWFHTWNPTGGNRL